MKETKDYKELHRIISEVNTPKERLCKAAEELYQAGFIAKAKSLETIIEKLEIWQNTTRGK